VRAQRHQLVQGVRRLTPVGITARITGSVLSSTGAPLSNARVMLTDRITQVSGTVTKSDGAPATDFTFVIFPEDDTKWTPLSRFVRSARPDQQGLVKIIGLPPNDRYLAVAVNYLEKSGASNPTFLEAIKGRASRFRLDEGAAATVDLTLVDR
jgi:hypothetical protein